VANSRHGRCFGTSEAGNKPVTPFGKGVRNKTLEVIPEMTAVGEVDRLAHSGA
jgi:hypothetical protein